MTPLVQVMHHTYGNNLAASLSSLSSSKPDRAKTMANQLTSKGYFAGEAVGFRFGRINSKGVSCSSSRILIHACL